jgi:predicted esterase
MAQCTHRLQLNSVELIGKEHSGDHTLAEKERVFAPHLLGAETCGRSIQVGTAVIPLLVVTFLLVSSVASAASNRDVAVARSTATSPPDELVYSPRDPRGAAPVTVFLHGMCDTPENECPNFADVVTRHGWLVCPRGPIACSNGGATWSNENRAERLEAAIARLRVRYPGRVADGERTLIGFSLGAFVAADLLQRPGHPWARALLIAAKAPFDPARFANGGAERVLLGAGDYDLSSRYMESAARRLSRAGLDVSFRSLGKVGHRFAFDMSDWLDGALGWLWAKSEGGAY